MSEHEVLSPLPGTFYRRPAPDAPPFKEDGAAVAVGDVLGLVEVMKNFQEVTAEHAGSSITFLAEDGEAIDSEQVLARISE
ncbi:MAG: biotin carboxyl carrier domain-containing protein [Gammaproteobacteria bacterium]|nr:biotin carboxyl carrier domain-containing protein [Gammaproteobacteria bacterium]